MADGDSQAPSREERMMSRSNWVDFCFHRDGDGERERPDPDNVNYDYKTHSGLWVWLQRTSEHENELKRSRSSCAVLLLTRYFQALLDHRLQCPL